MDKAKNKQGLNAANELHLQQESGYRSLTEDDKCLLRNLQDSRSLMRNDDRNLSGPR